MWVGHRTIDVLWENSDFIHWQALLFSENECRCFSMLKSLKTFMAERGHGVNKLVTGIMKGIQFICLFRAVLFERALLCLPQANPRDLLEKVFQWKKRIMQDRVASPGLLDDNQIGYLTTSYKASVFPYMNAPLLICLGETQRLYFQKWGKCHLNHPWGCCQEKHPDVTKHHAAIKSAS